MDLKSYMRGLGIGILVTAIIMGIALGRKQGMSDAQVKQRAAELGMVDSSQVLTESAKVEEETQEAVSEEVSLEEAVTEEVVTEEVEEEQVEEQVEEQAEEETTVEEVAEEVEESTVEERPEEETVEEQTVEEPVVEEPSADVAYITINSGDGSGTVSSKLEAVKVVASAKEFDKFLCAGGYDKKIRPGEYKIPMDASDEKIARIITGRE